MTFQKPEMLLLNYLTPDSTDCILLFTDNILKRGTITNYSSETDSDVLTLNTRSNGSWQLLDNNILISFDNGISQNIKYNKGLLYYTVDDGNRRSYYYVSTNLKLIDLVISLFNQHQTEQTT
jgi:hypothetical protein